MRRTLLYGTSGAVMVALLAIVATVTARRATYPPCPACEAREVGVYIMHSDSTRYRCRHCHHEFVGAARLDFSWMDAAKAWLGKYGLAEEQIRFSITRAGGGGFVKIGPKL